MIDKLLAPLAPHHCCGCGEKGSLICLSCINDITSEPFSLCVACARTPAPEAGVCGLCQVPYTRAWVCGVHDGALDVAIDKYKFEAARGGVEALATVVADCLSALPDNTVVVPVPTIAKHIRERGFDHTKLLGWELAKRVGRPCRPSLLVRRSSTVQRGASSRQRRNQAKAAFAVHGPVAKNTVYLLIDDVMTTGATLHYAAETLRQAGAEEVWVAVLARQVLS